MIFIILPTKEARLFLRVRGWSRFGVRFNFSTTLSGNRKSAGNDNRFCISC